MKQALISVSDKTGIVEFARGLLELGYALISTGGTYRALSEAGLSVTEVSEVTGFAECLDGRLKTLHPKVHGGILFLRDNEAHEAQRRELEIAPIDIVAVNLYPFKQTIMKPGVTLAEAIENIDIGGPTMLRAAAKNYRFVSAVCDAADYSVILDEIKSAGRVSETTNLRLAGKVFEHTAFYDALIAGYLKNVINGADDVGDGLARPANSDLSALDITKLYPQTLTLAYEKAYDLRYGENPHQNAAFYKEVTPLCGGLLSEAVQLHGKELSFNNINDTHGALELLKEFDAPAVVACKHANPCGVGTADTIYEAYIKAYTADPVSIFGGIVVANREIDEKTAIELNKIFVEIILAPNFTADALEVLKQKKNIRVLRLGNISAKTPATAIDLKKVSGGLLIQNADTVLLQGAENELRCATKRKPTPEETRDLLFAWKIVKYVKSNGIAIGKNGQSVGIGCGQMNRIWATRQAIEHAGEALGADILKGASLASDAFFPFADCAEAAAQAGITAIIQPGGSIKDNESIEECDKYGIAMVFTDMRHFRH